LLRRPFGATMRRIALTNAFVDLPTFFDIQVLAIERQWRLPANSTTLFVPLEQIKRSAAFRWRRGPQVVHAALQCEQLAYGALS